MADIFNEIDDDLRQERLRKLWERYGIVVIGLAVAIVLGTAIYVWYESAQRSRAEAAGFAYAQALDLGAAGNQPKEIEALQTLGKDGNAGYALLARLDAAFLKGKTDPKGAVADLDAVAADTNVDQAYRELATVAAGLYGVDALPPRNVIDKLAPLTIAPNPWRFTALEVSALAELKAGDQAAALRDYQSIASDTGAPESARTRAQEIIGELKS